MCIYLIDDAIQRKHKLQPAAHILRSSNYELENWLSLPLIFTISIVFFAFQSQRLSKPITLKGSQIIHYMRRAFKLELLAACTYQIACLHLKSANPSEFIELNHHHLDDFPFIHGLNRHEDSINMQIDETLAVF